MALTSDTQRQSQLLVECADTVAALIQVVKRLADSVDALMQQLAREHRPKAGPFIPGREASNANRESAK
jgi:hypothetical protein